jgi:hypothetical protein
MAEATFVKLGTKPLPGNPLANRTSIEAILADVPPELAVMLANLRDYIARYAGELVANVAVAVISATIKAADDGAEVIGAILGHLDAFKEMGHIAGYAQVSPKPLAPADTATLLFRGLRSQAEYILEVKRNGISADRAMAFLAAVRPILDIGSIHELKRRGLLNPVRALEAIQKQGYFPSEAQQISELSWQVPGAPELVGAYKRTLLTGPIARQKLGYLGIKGEDATRLLHLARELLTPQDIVAAWLREDFTQPVMDKHLEEHGYNPADRNEIRKLAFFLPPVPDLVRFAVREAFDPNQVKLLDLDAEFPKDFETWAKRQGVSTDWAHKYWQAHWELPSATQAFEMFHRTTHVRLDPTSPPLGSVKGKPYYRVISEATLKNLLKAVDYAPTWRPKMQEISFSPLTRVDIRRMHELGFLDKDGVRKAYHDDGYSPENVERITNFVEADVLDNYTGKVKNQLLTLFRRGVIPQAQLAAYLRKAKVPENFIKALIDSEIELREAEQLDKRVKAIERQFKRGIITAPLLLIRLVALNLSQETITHLVSLWTEEKLAAQNRISVKDLKKAHLEGLVSDDKLRAELRERNWQEDDITIMVKLSQGVDPDAAVEVT